MLDPKRLGIDEANLALRREFIGLGEADRAVLTPLIPWIEGEAATLARRFYDSQFEFGPTNAFFSRYAERQTVTP